MGAAMLPLLMGLGFIGLSVMFAGFLGEMTERAWGRHLMVGGSWLIGFAAFGFGLFLVVAAFA